MSEGIQIGTVLLSLGLLVVAAVAFFDFWTTEMRAAEPGFGVGPTQTALLIPKPIDAEMN